MFGQEGATDDERANEEPDRAGTRRCAGYLGYPFSNKKRKSQINTFSLPTSISDGEEMELRELSFTPFWNAYPQEQIQEEMAAVALVSPPGWEAALSQMLPALFRRVPLRSDLATSCWKAHCWLVRAIYEEDGSLASTNPPTAGSGRLVISSVASADGTTVYGSAPGFGAIHAQALSNVAGRNQGVQLLRMGVEQPGMIDHGEQDQRFARRQRAARAAHDRAFREVCARPCDKVAR